MQRAAPCLSAVDPQSPLGRETGSWDGKDACRGAELKVDSGELPTELHAAGLAVLMIDLRGHGTSTLDVAAGPATRAPSATPLSGVETPTFAF